MVGLERNRTVRVQDRAARIKLRADRLVDVNLVPVEADVGRTGGRQFEADVVVFRTFRLQVRIALGDDIFVLPIRPDRLDAV